MWVLIVWIICGIICAAIASGKGRSVVAWFFIGFFAGIIGLILVLCFSNLKIERARFDAIQRQSRRLREQLAQEQIKGESFRQYSTQRLDSHDQTLGVDTKSQQSMLGQGNVPAGYLPQQPASALDDLTAAATGNLPVQTGHQPLGQPLSQPPAHAVPPPPAVQPGKMWYFERSGQTFGPIPGPEIQKLAKDGSINGSTLVWSEGMNDWRPLSEISARRKT